ncbi:glycosyltransferase family 4 protein [Variovorax guangxiensis]|uniref:Glycosyltransferase n=1 Tax=Variovorax guangxiensis TaxID=1775474 RepID=A0A502DKN2_9BURK|nr:glycosyltransferase family 4 protein [Variovorax guangxiensis]TPG20620.1 glycosyltransferase [Variovorax ginsengisoli]TPG25793.1 glycosyltransferase [Variovorax guangxiensis]
MKVLLYSHAFHPSVGGVESVSMSLAEGFIANGIECKVVTHSRDDDVPTSAPTQWLSMSAPSSAPSMSPFGFEVIRQPRSAQVRELVRWADVVLFNGASMRLQPSVLFSRKPFVWVHVGYQVACIDGLGWVDNAPAPLTPMASVRFHAKRSGWPWALKQGLKLAVRRAVATMAVDRNVAITQWMAQALPLPRQVQIYNPFPIAQFAAADTAQPEFEFFYMGRLVQEKGVEVLVRAFAEVLRRRGRGPRLLMIGDGTARPAIEALVAELGVADAIAFVGRRTGTALVEEVGRGGIGIIPSVWYEPMGGVAIELMAAGKCLIVSAEGGLAECVGDAGLNFPNGDHIALADRMQLLLADPARQASLSALARQRAQTFMPERFVAQYIGLLRDVIARR